MGCRLRGITSSPTISCLLFPPKVLNHPADLFNQLRTARRTQHQACIHSSITLTATRVIQSPSWTILFSLLFPPEVLNHPVDLFLGPTKDSYSYSAPGMYPFKYNPYLSHPKSFLDYVADKLGWGMLLDATLLDVGCGTVRPQLGEWFHAKFPGMSHVVALDKDPGVISQCRKDYNGVAPIHFVVGGIDEDLAQISLTEEWVDKFDKVMSLNCFHLVPDLISAFDNLYLVTKLDGEIAVAFCLWSGVVETIDHVMELKKWDDYEREDAPRAPCLQDSEKDASAFEEMIRKRGFTIIQCEKIEVEQPYESEEDCKKNLLKNALLAYDIPTEHLSEFSDDVYKCFLECSERIDDGQKVARYTYLMVLARKYGSTELFSDSTTDSAVSE